MLRSFCDNVGLTPAVLHPTANVDYTYHFGLSRFNVLDHFLLSRTLFHNAVDNLCVLHDIDNMSDHDPVALRLNLQVNFVQCADRVHTPHISWVKATSRDIESYRCCLQQHLNNIVILCDALLCRNMLCCDAIHVQAINTYANSITQACLLAAEHTMPHTSSRQQGRRVPGWSERVQPLRDRSLFGTTCGCPVAAPGLERCPTA